MNQTILITGASSGIGLALTRKMAKMGNHVLALCRDDAANRNTIAKIDEECQMVKRGRAEFIPINLNNMHSVRQAAHTLINFYAEIDVIVCNAGVKAPPFFLTQQKFEQQFQVNYLAQFLLAHLLMPSLNNVKYPKVVFVGDEYSEKGKISNIDELIHIAKISPQEYQKEVSYCESKLAQLCMSKHMSEVFKNIMFATFNPEPTLTNLNRREYGVSKRVLTNPLYLMGKVFGVFQDPDQTADQLSYFILTPEFESGKLWQKDLIIKSNPIADNKEYCAQLYHQSMVWVGLAQAN